MLKKYFTVVWYRDGEANIAGRTHLYMSDEEHAVEDGLKIFRHESPDVEIVEHYTMAVQDLIDDHVVPVPAGE